MEARHESKTKLLDAALHVIRAKGYTATRVEDLCAEAGVTKGSFFHHFKSKEDLALQAAAYWGERTNGFFLTAEYHQQRTARERLLAYVELRKALLQGELPEFTCFAGTMVQEVYQTEPAILEACAGTIEGHAQTLEADVAEAMRDCGMEADWTPASLALHTQAVIQGAFILAKAQGSAQIAVESLNHLRRYLELLFVPQSHAAIAA
jgi:TetR/AcrR family transcriptional repressor of nem operon